MPDDHESIAADRPTLAHSGIPPRRGVRQLILTVGLALLLACAILAALPMLIFLPSMLAGTTNARNFPRYRAIFEDLHGRHARLLPPAIPETASETRFKATLDDLLQAEPYLYLALRFPKDAADAELARLRSLNLRIEGPDPFAPTLLRDLGMQCDQAITLDFAPAHTSNMIRALVWHDPVTGWFCYEITSD